MTGRHDLRTAGLLLIDAAIVAAGTTVALLFQVNPWIAVPVGLAAYTALYAAAVTVLHRQDRWTPR